MSVLHIKPVCLFDCWTLMASHLPVEVGSLHHSTQLLYILLVVGWRPAIIHISPWFNFDGNMNWSLFNKNDTNQGAYNSKELTYPLAKALLKRIFLFSQGGIFQYPGAFNRNADPKCHRRRVISSPPTDAEQMEATDEMRKKKTGGEADWLTDCETGGCIMLGNVRAECVGCFQKQGYPKMDGL